MNSVADHTWRTRSRHDVSDGVVIYQSCHCGLWQIQFHPFSTHTAAIIADRIGAAWRPTEDPATRRSDV